MATCTCSDPPKEFWHRQWCAIILAEEDRLITKFTKEGDDSVPKTSKSQPKKGSK